MQVSVSLHGIRIPCMLSRWRGFTEDAGSSSSPQFSHIVAHSAVLGFRHSDQDSSRLRLTELDVEIEVEAKRRQPGVLRRCSWFVGWNGIMGWGDGMGRWKRIVMTPACMAGNVVSGRSQSRPCARPAQERTNRQSASWQSDPETAAG